MREEDIGSWFSAGVRRRPANEAALPESQIQHSRVPVTANPRRWARIAPARSSINRRIALMDSARTIAARSPESNA